VPPSGPRRAALAAADDFGGSVFEVALDGDDAVTLDEGPPVERVIHAGGLEFVRADRPWWRFRLALDGERAGWWLLEEYGFPKFVGRRVE